LHESRAITSDLQAVKNLLPTAFDRIQNPTLGIGSLSDDMFTILTSLQTRSDRIISTIARIEPDAFEKINTYNNYRETLSSIVRNQKVWKNLLTGEKPVRIVILNQNNDELRA